MPSAFRNDHAQELEHQRRCLREAARQPGEHAQRHAHAYGQEQADGHVIVSAFALGAAFVGMEVFEFADLAHRHAVPQASAYLSAYFTLVGTHGLHVSFGLLWLVVMVHQIHHFGLTPVTRRRLACLSLFWHFLDLVWICVFTFVYLREFT